MATDQPRSSPHFPLPHRNKERPNDILSQTRSFIYSPPVQFWYGITSQSALAGFLIGFPIGARLSGLQYTAENSHLRPQQAVASSSSSNSNPANMAGWFQYHRRKKYRMILEGAKTGLTYAGRFGLLLGGFYGVDVALDELRGSVEWWHGLVSAGFVSSAFCLSEKFSKSVTGKALRMSGIVGLGYSATIYALLYFTESAETRNQIFSRKILPMEKYNLILSEDMSNANIDQSAVNADLFRS